MTVDIKNVCSTLLTNIEKQVSKYKDLLKYV